MKKLANHDGIQKNGLVTFAHGKIAPSAIMDLLGVMWIFRRT
ncbi:hypothetical protein ApDm4_0005 [Acetobacter pomorum]|nr:hypothetical protein ApDm4_0005 [Acetobacter pomorum]